MLKLPNPQWIRNIKRLAVVCFVAEGLAFAGSYLFWSRLNTNREFRYYCHKNYPFALEGYYKIGEFFDKEGAARSRETDLAVWAAETPKIKQKLN